MYTLVIKPTEELDWREGRGYGHTTLQSTSVLDITSQYTTIIERRQYSKMLRQFILYVRPYIEECDRELFETTFNTILGKLIFDLGITPNANFSTTLFADDSFMNSSLYKNNENHLLELFDGPKGSNKYICAVYIDEIIWVIKTIVDTLKSILDIDINMQISMEDKKPRVDSVTSTPTDGEYNILEQIDRITAQLTEVTSQLLILKNNL